MLAPLEVELHCPLAGAYQEYYHKIDMYQEIPANVHILSHLRLESVLGATPFPETEIYGRVFKMYFTLCLERTQLSSHDSLPACPSVRDL